jgi:8-oxo-dGTP diphosphatase
MSKDELKNYQAPALSVDMVLFQIIDRRLYVLLINRADAPFKGMWALPGGYNPVGETTTQALSRIVRQKAGVDITDLAVIEQLYAFDTVARDPRGHCLSVTYMGLGLGIVPLGSKTTHQPQFYPVDELPELAFDHADIIRFARERLIERLKETSIVYGLLPSLFTMTLLQETYEAVFGHELDKRNFRKKFQSLNLIVGTDEFHQTGAHRPARFYKFNSRKVIILSKDFD